MFCWGFKDYRGQTGPGGTALRITTSTEKKKLTKPYQEPTGASRTHLGSTSDAPGAHRTTFQLIATTFQLFTAPNPRARPSPPEPRSTILRFNPSHRITRMQGPFRFPGRTHPPTSDTLQSANSHLGKYRLCFKQCPYASEPIFGIL